MPLNDGAYSQLPAWPGRDTWLETVEDTLLSTTGKRARDARGHISPDSVLTVARVIADACDSRTGRNLALANATVGTRAKVGSRTAQRALAVLADLGYLVTVAKGRYLTRAERAQARAHHGARQLRAASIRALTIPKPPAPCPRTVDIGDLPRKGLTNVLTNGNLYSPTRASARVKAATRPQVKKKKKPTPQRTKPWPLHIQKAAAQLITRSPWLETTGISTSQVCQVLDRSGIDYTEWTGNDVIDCIDAWHKHAGMPAPKRVKNPLGWLTTILRRVNYAVTDLGWKPLAQRARERDEARQRRENARAKARAAEEAAYTPPSTETKALIADLRAQLQARSNPSQRARMRATLNAL